MPLRYTNPIWPGYFADPFVLQWKGRYFAYGTGAAHDATAPAGVFEVLHSPDLVHWKQVGRALTLSPEQSGHVYWAPEVVTQDGQFYLYYSSALAGHDEQHRLHVATSSRPEGPYRTVGRVLPEAEGFCIDAHPFRDPRDDQWYLFFAKDFFDERAGTGLAVAPLERGMVRTSAPSRTVIRANADWQVYERNRSLYGREWVAWHTVEGPCVVAHDGRYYCFYSGGNWQTRDYGVSFAVSHHPLGPWTHAVEPGPIVLQEKPGEVLGPGHNSYTISPEGAEVLVYHARDPHRRARRMCLDRLLWTVHGPRCMGPTTTEQTF